MLKTVNNWEKYFLLFVISLCLTKTISAQKEFADDCKIGIVVGVIESNSKNKQFPSWELSRIVASSLSQGKKVIALTTDKTLSQTDFEEQALTKNPAFLLTFKVNDRIEKHTALNVFGGLTVNMKKSPDYFYDSISYELKDAVSKTIVKSKQIAGNKENPAFGGKSYEELNTKLAERIKDEVSDLVRDGTVDTVTVKRLLKKHACFSNFPTNPKSLIMEYDIKTSTKTVSHTYFIQGHLWRIDTATKDKKHSMGFNGEKVWDTDGKNLQTNSPGDMLTRFVIGNFIDSGIGDLENRIMTSVVQKRIESINGVSCYVVESKTSADTIVKTFYDVKTGALVKKSKLDKNGSTNQEFFFGSYDDIGNGVRFPLNITSSGKEGNFEIIFKQIEGIVINASIDNKIFLKYK